MSNTRIARVLCLALVLLMAPGMVAFADDITTNGRNIVAYYDRDTSQPAVSLAVNETGVTAQGGWYPVSTMQGTMWVLASDVTVTNATVTETATTTATATATASGAATVTASPTPTTAVIGGNKDTTFDGQVITYTVPNGTGGLGLYTSRSASGSAAEIVPQGSTVTLTQVIEKCRESACTLDPIACPCTCARCYDSVTMTVICTCTDAINWYSIYRNGKTYYVPASSLVYSSATTIPNASIRSVVLTSNATYFTSHTRNQNVFSGPVGDLIAGVRINATYVDDYAFSFTDSGKTYYFRSSEVDPTSHSTATVVGNDAINLVTRITVPANSTAKLYRTTSTDDKDYFALKTTDAVTLNAENADKDGWYRVVYNNQYFYILKTDIAGWETEQVVNDSGANTVTYWVSTGVNGARIYDSYANTVSDPPYDTTSSYIGPGTSVRVGTYNASWYTYAFDGTIKYLNVKDFTGYATETGAVSAYRIRLYHDTNFYDRMGTTRAAFTLDLGGAGNSDMFVVKSLDADYYSIEYNNKTYYLKKSEIILTGVDDLYEIADTTDGKTYTVTLTNSAGTAPQLYNDSTCQTVSLTYPAGTTLTATRYNASLYTVTIGGKKHYLPVRYVASIKGGDDATNSSGSSSEGIGEIIQGEQDDTYTDDVFSYTIPASGLWLYYSNSLARPAMSLDSGRTIQLSNYPNDSSWYATWYAGTMYAVPRSALTLSSDTSATVGSSMSIVLANTAVLYATVACNDTGNTNTGRTGETIASGTRINVKVASLLTANEKANMPGTIVTDRTKNYVRAYSTDYGGKTRYFLAYSSLTDPSATTIANPGDTLLALLTSNTDANLITRFNLTGGNITLYTSDSKSSSGVRVSGPETLYGVKYTTGWYKIAYNNSVWYMNATDYENLVTAGNADPLSQLSVAGDVASNTYTVVIAAGGVQLYRIATANAVNYYYDSGSVATFAGGSVVMANKVNATWYSATYPATGDTVYFQNSGVSNANTNASVQSYVVTLPDLGNVAPNNVLVTVYSTISLTMPTPVRTNGFGLLEGGTYTLRTVDSTWASVTLSGKTYYVKTADIYAADASAMENRIAIASTTVGKTYTITIGDPTGNGNSVPFYRDSKLTNAFGTQIPSGYTTTGTKLYIEDANNTSSLVFQVKYSGSTGYIDAKYVVGVKDGDEVDEAKEAETTEDKATDMEVGASKFFAINAGSTLYKGMTSSSDTIKLPLTGTYLLTRVDDTWFKLTYNGQIYYMRASDLATSSSSTGDGEASGGANIAVGTTFMQTLQKSASAYASPSTSASIVGTVLPNQLLQLTKVSDYWYELDRGNGTKVYLTATDVFGAPSEGGTGSTGQTTDGTGIITSQIKIVPNSGSVNLRKTASLSATIMARIPKDTIVPNHGYEVVGGTVWYKTTYQGKSGYVVGTYVQAVGTASGGSSSGGNPAADIGRTLTINVSTVNIRSGAGPSFSILGRLDKDTAIVPTSYSTGTDGMVWYAFQYTSSLVGYIRSDYLNGSAAGTDLSGNVAIKAGGTNLRSGAGSSFTVVTKLDRDTIVTIVGSGTDSNNVLWYRVTYLNVSGYVRSDLVRQLTTSESSGLFNDITTGYSTLQYGSQGAEVLALQQQLISLGYMTGTADGYYGNTTTNAVKAFQAAKGMSQTGIADASLQATLFNTSNITSGTTVALDWFSNGVSLLSANPNLSVYDINTGVTWSAKYVEGGNHADVVPASSTDANKLKANNITGSYVRRPVIVTVGGQKYAGSMYAVGHGSKNFVSYFSGVMCIHFTGSKTHGSGNVDADHQAAINSALQYANKTY